MGTIFEKLLQKHGTCVILTTLWFDKIFETNWWQNVELKRLHYKVEFLFEILWPCYFNFQSKTAILVGMYKLHFGFMIAEQDHSELTTATKYMWHATLSRACLNLSHFHVSIKMTPHFEVYVLRSTYTALILDTRNVILKIK